MDESPVTGLDPIVVALCLPYYSGEFTMPFFTKETSQYFVEEQPKPSLLGGDPWGTTHKIGAEVPLSGIYRCTGCGDEITSNKGDKFPPQNSHQHDSIAGVAWKLVARTKTK